MEDSGKSVSPSTITTDAQKQKGRTMSTVGCWRVNASSTTTWRVLEPSRRLQVTHVAHEICPLS